MGWYCMVCLIPAPWMLGPVCSLPGLGGAPLFRNTAPLLHLCEEGLGSPPGPPLQGRLQGQPRQLTEPCTVFCG